MRSGNSDYFILRSGNSDYLEKKIVTILFCDRAIVTIYGTIVTILSLIVTNTANSRQFGNLHALLQHFCRSVRNAAERCGKRAEQCRTVQDSQECDSWLAFIMKSHLTGLTRILNFLCCYKVAGWAVAWPAYLSRYQSEPLLGSRPPLIIN